MEINTLGKFDKTNFTPRKRRLSGPDRTTHDGHPDVFLSMMDDKDKDGKSLMCTATGFNTEDIVLNIKKNHCVLTEEDGVKTSGVRQHPDDTFWREEFGKCLKSDVSQYSCEVIHAESAFRLEKLWDPDSDGKGRIISSKFIDTIPPDVKMFAENSEVQTNNIVTCLVSGFYPNNITVNMKRNGRILTREDGVKSSGVCSYGGDVYQRRDSVEIRKLDPSNFSCEVFHAASGSRFEKFWDHQLLPPHSDGAGDDRDKRDAISAGLVGVLAPVLVFFLLLSLAVFLRRRFAAKRRRVSFTPGMQLRGMASTRGTKLSVYSDKDDEDEDENLQEENV